MYNFLDRTLLRQLRILEHSDWDNGYIPYEKMMTMFDISRSSLLKDLQTIQSFSDKFKIQTDNKQFRTVYLEAFSFVEILQEIVQDNVYFDIIRAIFLNSNLSVEELSHIISASQASTYRYIDYLNNIFKSNKLDILIKQNPCRMTGNEIDIRYFLFQLFCVDSIFLEESILEYQAIIDKIMNTLDEQLPNFIKDYSFFVKIKTMLFVNFKRYSQGFSQIPIQQPLFIKEYINELMNESDLISSIEEEIQEELTEEILQVLFFPFFNSKLLLLLENDPTKLDSNRYAEIQADFDYLLDIINDISETFNIPLANPQTQSAHLYNELALFKTFKRSYVLISNLYNPIYRTYQEYFPHFYHYLYDKFTDLSLKYFDQEIYEFIIACLMNILKNWDNLLFNINDYNRPFHILLVNPVQPNFVHNFKNLIETTLSKQLEISTCHMDQISEQAYDILISNSLLNDDNYAYIFCPNPYDPFFIQQLQLELQKIRHQRYEEILERHKSLYDATQKPPGK